MNMPWGSRIVLLLSAGPHLTEVIKLMKVGTEVGTTDRVGRTLLSDDLGFISATVKERPFMAALQDGKGPALAVPLASTSTKRDEGAAAEP
jgi:hypothetical protein